VDAKTAPDDFSGCASMAHVHRVPSLQVCWGGFSVVDATIRLMESALRYDTVTHLVLLSGACYPIRPVGDLVTVLDEDPDREHIRYLAVDASTEHLHLDLRRRWFFDLDRRRGGRPTRRLASAVCRRALPPRKTAPDGVTAYYGSQWWALTRGCAHHVVEAYHRERSLVAYHRKSLAPDELFIQTVVANSPFAASEHRIAYNGRRTYENCALHLIYPSRHTVLDRRRGLTPGIVEDSVDLELLRDSGKFFVRKVIAGQGVDCIDEQLLEVFPPRGVRYT
jgi:hypothetical protein